MPNQTYTVQDGDTFYKIAQSQLGDGNRYQEIAQLNPGVNPTDLQLGSTLNIPAQQPQPQPQQQQQPQ